MIALDGTASSSVDAGSAPLDFNHTVAGSDRLLLVGVGASSDVVTGVTYNGDAMSQLVKVGNASYGQSYIYGLLAPDTGVNVVSVNWTGSSFVRAVSASYTGVKQSNLPEGTAAQNTESNVSSLTTSVQTLLANSWAFMVTRSGGTLSAGTNQTQRGLIGASNFLVGDSNGGIIPAQLFPMTSNNTPATGMSQVMVSFQDVNATGGILTGEI